MKLTVNRALGTTLTLLTPARSQVAFRGKIYRFMGADRNDDGSFTVGLKALNLRETDNPLNFPEEMVYGKEQWE